MLISLFLPDRDVLTVLFPHTARDDDELTLNYYDKVRVIEKDDSGWWRGRLQDKEGLFPSRCVVVTVLFPHTARNDDELTVDVNDEVTVIEKDEGGWWRGRLHDKDGLHNREGLLPSTCVVLGNAMFLYIFDPWNFSKLKNVQVRYTTTYLNLIFLYY